MGLPAHAPPTQVPTTSPAAGFKMLRLNALLLLSTFFTVGLAVKCWQTGNSAMVATSLRSSAVPIVEVECSGSSATCMRKWWTMAKKSDVFYSLGCSTEAVMAEKETTKGTGKEGLSYCDKDYCNSSNLASPLVGLLVAALVSVLVH